MYPLSTEEIAWLFWPVRPSKAVGNASTKGTQHKKARERMFKNEEKNISEERDARITEKVQDGFKHPRLLDVTYNTLKSTLACIIRFAKLEELFNGAISSEESNLRTALLI